MVAQCFPPMRDRGERRTRSANYKNRARAVVWTDIMKRSCEVLASPLPVLLARAISHDEMPHL